MHIVDSQYSQCTIDSRFGVAERTIEKTAGRLLVRIDLYTDAMTIEARWRGWFKTHKLEIILEQKAE